MDEESAGPVVIGMDPHKRTVTIEVMTSSEEVVGHGRFTADEAGFAALLEYARRWPDRTWAVEGCEGIGRHIVARLLPLGEEVVDVPAKLSARMRVFATGQGRKTDDTDAHSIALVGVRMGGLRTVARDETLEMLRLLVDRRRRLGEDHTRRWCASCTRCCWRSSRVGRRRTCPRRRPARSSPAYGPRTRWEERASGWRWSSWWTSRGSTHGRRPRTRSSPS